MSEECGSISTLLPARLSNSRGRMKDQVRRREGSNKKKRYQRQTRCAAATAIDVFTQFCFFCSFVFFLLVCCCSLFAVRCSSFLPSRACCCSCFSDSPAEVHPLARDALVTDDLRSDQTPQNQPWRTKDIMTRSLQDSWRYARVRASPASRQSHPPSLRSNKAPRTYRNPSMRK